MVGNCEICASGSQITYLPFHSCSGQVFMFIGALARSLVQLGNWKLVTVCGGSNNNVRFLLSCVSIACHQQLKLNCKVTNYMNCFLNLRHTSFLIGLLSWMTLVLVLLACVSHSIIWVFI